MGFGMVSIMGYSLELVGFMSCGVDFFKKECFPYFLALKTVNTLIVYYQSNNLLICNVSVRREAVSSQS
jgi:hypothetical protein